MAVSTGWEQISSIMPNIEKFLKKYLGKRGAVLTGSSLGNRRLYQKWYGQMMNLLKLAMLADQQAKQDELAREQFEYMKKQAWADRQRQYRMYIDSKNRPQYPPNVMYVPPPQIGGGINWKFDWEKPQTQTARSQTMGLSDSPFMGGNPFVTTNALSTAYNPSQSPPKFGNYFAQNLGRFGTPANLGLPSFKPMGIGQFPNQMFGI